MNRALVARFCWVAGAALVLFYVVARIDGAVGSSRTLAQFDSAVGASASPQSRADTAQGPLPDRLAVDFSLWDPKRISEYEASFAHQIESPLAVLEIPKLSLRVPVLNGTDDLRLNRGVGRVRGTAWPGKPGNLAIAGHRDGFFRGLKDVTEGDLIRLQTHAGTSAYEIRRLSIVKPADVHVLAETAIPTVTLITCYPFNFVGSAPDRFIVQAEIVGSVP